MTLVKGLFSLRTIISTLMVILMQSGHEISVIEGNLVTWRSKMQKLVALSNAESEYEFRVVPKGLSGSKSC